MFNEQIKPEMRHLTDNSRQKVREVLVQKDTRTSLSWKKLYAWFPLTLSLLVFLLIIGMSNVHANCCHSDKTATNFVYYSNILLAFTSVVFSMNIYAIVFPDYMWLKTHYYHEKWYGHDVEDPNPYILAREGHRISRDAIKTLSKVDALTNEYLQGQQEIEENFERKSVLD